MNIFAMRGAAVTLCVLKHLEENDWICWWMSLQEMMVMKNNWLNLWMFLQRSCCDIVHIKTFGREWLHGFDAWWTSSQKMTVMRQWLRLSILCFQMTCCYVCFACQDILLNKWCTMVMTNDSLYVMVFTKDLLLHVVWWTLHAKKECNHDKKNY